MRRFVLLPLLLLTAAACDSEPTPLPADDAFSLTVTVRGADGQPVAGQELALVYGLSETGRAPLASAGALRVPEGEPFLSVPFPNPWETLTRLQVRLPRAVRASRLDVLDVEGALRHTLALPTEEGVYQFVLRGDSLGGSALRGGVYRLVATFDDTTVEQWTLHSELFADLPGVWGRRLGRTGADGSLRVADRTVAPGLFDVPPIDVTDETGASRGQLDVPREATVVLLGDDGVPADRPRASVQFADGPVSVTLRL